MSRADDEVRDHLAPHLIQDAEGMSVLAACLASVLEDSTIAVRDLPDGRSAWALLCDPAVTPAWALPWLAIHAGIPPTAGLNELELRAAIGLPEGHRRGTLAAMLAAGRRALSEPKARIVFRERTNPAQPGTDAAYHLLLITYEAQTPSAARFLAAAITQKPAGLILHHQVLSGQTYGELLAGGTYTSVLDSAGVYGALIGRTYRSLLGGTTYSDVRFGYASYGAVKSKVPSS